MLSRCFLSQAGRQLPVTLLRRTAGKNTLFSSTPHSFSSFSSSSSSSASSTLSRLLSLGWKKGVQATGKGGAPTYRFCSTTTAEVAANRQVGKWLLGCAGLVYGMVIVGGLTRLTGSGLSMTDWKFTGSFPPLTNKEWEKEFEKYKQFPQYQRENMDMTVSEFKGIFWWEWGHRFLGRFIGLSFLLPGTYFLATGKLKGKLLAQCSALFAGICGQGLLGWYMVKSGLDLPEEKRAAVSQYRLTAHLGSAFCLYGGMLWVGLQNYLAPYGPEAGKAVQSLSAMKTLSCASLAMLTTTILSGCLVAGLNAGTIYNSYPLMGGDFVPSDYWEEGKDLLDNMGSNSSAVQFNHRWVAMATAGTILTLSMKAKKAGLPKRARIVAVSLGHMAILQVALGISTLLLIVPVHLASAHQAGALTLWSLTLWLLQELRRLPK